MIQKLKKYKPYIIYTGLFAIMSILVFYNFIKLGKSLIREGDGFYQHFVFLNDFSEIIKNTLKNIGNGIPLFSWEMGLGLDIIGQYSYYVTGDPFSYIALLFSNNNLEFVYCMNSILRMYMCGITFMIFAKYHKKGDLACIIGSIMYAVSAFNFTYGILHPYFINAVIILPIMFLAVDKLIKNNTIKMLIFMAFVNLIMNYYFFYKITIMVYLYAIVRLICEYRQEGWKFIINKMLKMVLAYIIAVLMAGVVILPTIYTFLNSDRFGTGLVLYNSSYYQNLLIGGKGFSTIFWIPVIGLLTIPITLLNYKKDGEKSFIVLFILETIMLLIPFVGSLMNGFSFPINRWSFGYTFLLVYLCINGIKEDFKYSKKEILIMCITSFMYIFILLFLNKIDIDLVKMSIAFIIVYLAIIILKNLEVKNNVILKYINKYAMIIVSMVICINIVAYANIHFSVKYDNNVVNFLDYGKALDTYASCNKQIENFKKAISKIKKEDKGFYRIGEITKYSKNESLLYNYKAINSYFSLGNGDVGQLSRDILNKYYEKVDALNGLDNRTKITTLLANKYYVAPKNKNFYVPYGYKLKEEIKNDKDKENPTQVYENTYALPIGVFYDNYTTQEDYQNLTALEKEQIILDTAVVEDETKIAKYNIENYITLIEDIRKTTTQNHTYRVIEGKELIDNKIIKTVRNQQSIKLNIDRIKDCELYVMFEGLKYTPYAKKEWKEIELGQNYTKLEEEKFLNKYKNYTENYSYQINVYYNEIDSKISVEDKKKSAYYVNISDKLVNLGYLSEHSGNIKITFSVPGKYHYDSIKIISVPMNKYKQSITKLKSTEFIVEKYDSNYLKGKIEVSTSGILQLSTPYTKGWNAYIDGEKVEIINVNTAFIGIPLKEGKHEIYLKYETPFLKLGITLTIIGTLAFIVVVRYEVVKRKI